MALLARLYLKVKVYITKLLSVYNLQKISCLNWSNFVWVFIFLRIPPTLKTYLYWTLNELQFSNFVSYLYWTLNELQFSNFVSYVTNSRYVFYWMSLFSAQLMERKRTKINSSTIFEGRYLNLRGEKMEIHRHSWL